jgi:hypothetical protein
LGVRLTRLIALEDALTRKRPEEHLEGLQLEGVLNPNQRRQSGIDQGALDAAPLTLDTYSHAIPAMQETAASLVASLVFDD